MSVSSSRCCRRRSSTTCWSRPVVPRLDGAVPGPPSREFPLFPLGIVALPGELIPLHIFEERYKTMIDECIGQGREFGIVWLSDDGLREVGCACPIDRVLERMR